MRGLVAIPVLRAGLGLLEAVVDLYPDAVVGYLGMERDEITHLPRDYYAKLPPMADRRALVVDPMLATGGSGSAAVRYVKEAGADDIAFMCVVAAPEGLARMQADHPDVPIVTAALDRELNDQRLHPAGPRRLRRSPVRYGPRASSASRAAALVRPAGGGRRSYPPHEPGDHDDRHDVRRHADELVAG